ncbi:MAG: bifunctional glutamate N-acetyltransferase/amino-acid acetyltransferase ArgJ [Pseudomonadota bacterium]|nr:bifunctional glutamate N-acetyltransferase/amino-acid acetyltransferase ArgJ [Pseudomonadota bacterium]
MAVGLIAPAQLLPINGIRLSALAAGIRYPDRVDLALVEIAKDSSATAVFTRNAFRAAPVIVAQEHLARCVPRYLLINAGNANAGTGEAGIKDAALCCRALAERVGCRSEEVLPVSTGVIGQRLPIDRIIHAIPSAIARLAPDTWLQAAAAIMTTDTVVKGVSRTAIVNGKPLVITGIAKGAGMIHPDMATMLAFIATDAKISSTLLKAFLHAGVEQSFSRITVDGDTSTNDACVLIATGASETQIDSEPEKLRGRFQGALNEVLIALAQAIVRDGEGATKFITVAVRGAASREEARRTAFVVADSSLVKTACFASDPNWGRILAAVGRANIEQLAIDRVNIFLDDLSVVRAGTLDADYTEADGRQVMVKPEMTLRIDLGRGDAEFHVWTSDLSYDYVRINAEYRS